MDEILITYTLNLVPARLAKIELIERIRVFFEVFSVPLEEQKNITNRILSLHGKHALTRIENEIYEIGCPLKKQKINSLLVKAAPLLIPLRQFFEEARQQNFQNTEEVLRYIRVVYSANAEMLNFFIKFFKCDSFILAKEGTIESTEFERLSTQFQEFCEQLQTYSQNIPNKLQAFFLFLYGFPEHHHLFSDSGQLILLRTHFRQLTREIFSEVAQCDLFLTMLNFFDTFSLRYRYQVFDYVARYMEYSYNSSSIEENPETLIEFLIEHFLVDPDDERDNLRYDNCEALIHSLVILGVINRSREEHTQQEVKQCLNSLIGANIFTKFSRISRTLRETQILEMGKTITKYEVFCWLDKCNGRINLEEAKLATYVLKIKFPTLLRFSVESIKYIEEYFEFASILPKSFCFNAKIAQKYVPNISSELLSAEEVISETVQMKSEVKSIFTFLGRMKSSDFCIFIACRTVGYCSDYEIGDLEDLVKYYYDFSSHEFSLPKKSEEPIL
ncbi:MAG: hypothetical protein LBJ93_03555 [Clostridiales bacterium]|jgi:hypothetical protein|nr:hypothetical protein [Clostridiales bacterium]